MSGESRAGPDLDALVAELKAKVEHRRANEYPAGLVDDLSAHFRRLLERRVDSPSLDDVRAAMDRVNAALPLRPDRIPIDSQVPGGHAFHTAVGKLVGRQTQGVLEQVQEFAEPARVTLLALKDLLEDLRREVQEELVPQLFAALDRGTAQSSGAARFPGGAFSARQWDSGDRFKPWYSSERFEDEFRGTRQAMLERYRDVAERLRGSSPVFEIGSGRGEFLELLKELGVEASGVDLDADLVKIAAEKELPVEQREGLEALTEMDDGTLGAVVLVQVIEHLSSQDVVRLVDLAAAKVRPGGSVVVETVNPQSLYVFAHSFYVDPTHIRPVHPAYLTFLFREAGFHSVDVEWRSPPPAQDMLEDIDEPPTLAANTRRLNQLLFAPQDYLLFATR